MKRPLRLTKLLRAVAIALLLPASAASAETNLTFSSFSGPVNFGLGIPSERRFTYYDFNETRGEKALRTLQLSMGGIGGEVWDMVTFPVRDPKTTALFLLGTAALISVDRQTTEFWQDSVEPAFDGFTLPDLGFGPSWMSTESQYVLAGIGLTYAGGLAFNDERAQTAALLSVKAIGYSYLASQVILKPIFGRLRPEDNLSSTTGSGTYPFTTDPWQFGHTSGIPFTGGAEATSMPSFHFTQYFAVARVYSGVYDNYLIPYALAGLISAVNIRDHNHWVSDMVAGAVIGTGIGNLVLNRYEDRKNDFDNGMLIPLVSQNAVGVQFVKSF